VVALKRFLLAVWEVWERIFARWYRLQNISGAGDGLLRIALRRYKGKPIQLKDGTFVRFGDLIGELHLANPLILKMHRQALSPAVVAREVARQMGAGVGRLREMMLNVEIPVEIKAFCAVTLFYRRAGALGFEIREAKARAQRWQSVYLRWLMSLYHPAGRERLRARRTDWLPKEIWLSQQSLMTKQSSKDGSNMP